MQRNGSRRRRLRLVPSIVLLLLGVCFLSLSALPVASADDVCVEVPRPDDMFEVDDAAGRWFVDWNVEEQTQSRVDLFRRVSLAGAEARGFSSAALDRIASYFDAIEVWWAYLDDPCADAVPYAGPFDATPTAAPAPYGFGGVDVTALQPVQMGFIDAVPVVEATPVLFAVDENRPALANSGSESFVLAYFGAGLLAFGATALGMRHWMGGPLEAED